MNTTTIIPGSLYRFAADTDYKRTAVALKDGRFLEVKPIRQMFANGDAWSVSFMGEGATLADGIATGKITVEHKHESEIPCKNSPSQEETKEKQIAKQISMLNFPAQRGEDLLDGFSVKLKSLQEKSRNIQNDIRKTMDQLTSLQMLAFRFDSERSFVEDTIAMLIQRTG